MTRTVALAGVLLLLAVVFFDRLDFRDFPAVETEFALSCARSDTVISLARPNLHDAVYLKGQAGDRYDHYLLLSSEPGIAVLLGSDDVSVSPTEWDLLSDRYVVHGFYESDDAISVGDRHFVFENGEIFAVRGDPADGSGAWEVVGSFPADTDDVGVYFDGEVVHLFGEYGVFPDGYDGTSIAYYRGTLAFDDWTLVDDAIAKPSGPLPSKWGIGDATIAPLGSEVVMITDIESKEIPYHLALWVAPGWGERFQFAGIFAAPSPGEDQLDNHRVQDAEFVITDDGRTFVFANWRDLDGQPGQDVPMMEDGTTRFVGSYLCGSERALGG